MEVEHPNCINNEAKTLDDFIFDYFNNAYPDEMRAVMALWRLDKAEKNDLEKEL